MARANHWVMMRSTIDNDERPPKGDLTLELFCRKLFFESPPSEAKVTKHEKSVSMIMRNG
jgi:hypothetical protein